MRLPCIFAAHFGQIMSERLAGTRSRPRLRHVCPPQDFWRGTGQNRTWDIFGSIAAQGRYISAMHSTFSRRGFLKQCAVTGLAVSPVAAFAIDPFQHSSPPRLQLSLAAYSFRDYFKDSDHTQKAGADPSKRIDLYRFVDYCAEQGCAGTELTCYYFPKETDEAFLLKLRRHCFLRGVDVSGGAVGNTFTHPPGEKRDEQMRYTKKWVDHYAVLGAPHIRVFAGNVPRGMAKEDATRLCIAALEECADYAGKRGIFLGIENHGGIV